LLAGYPVAGCVPSYNATCCTGAACKEACKDDVGLRKACMLWLGDINIAQRCKLPHLIAAHLHASQIISLHPHFHPSWQVGKVPSVYWRGQQAQRVFVAGLQAVGSRSHGCCNAQQLEHTAPSTSRACGIPRWGASPRTALCTAGALRNSSKYLCLQEFICSRGRCLLWRAHQQTRPAPRCNMPHAICPWYHCSTTDARARVLK
jgi:hypothetical protein